MSHSQVSSFAGAAGAVAALALTLPATALAASAAGGASASASVKLRVIVPPVFKVLRVERVADRLRYRVWTNMPSAHVGGQLVRFERVGEATIDVPASAAAIYIQPAL